MKKNLPLIILVLLMIVLSGCECEHEWTPADCVNPQVCTKCEATGESALGHNLADATCSVPETCTRCGETQGDSLGHNWAAATCSAPEVCTRCGETQGEALTHSYGDWTFGEEDMTRVCSVCNLAETTEIDRALYLGTLLPGHWDFFGLMQQDGSMYFAQQLEFVDVHLYFDAEGGVALTTPEGGTVQGTWTFDTFVQDGDTGTYTFMLHCGETNYVMWMQVNSGSDTVFPEKMLILFSRKQMAYLSQYANATDLLTSDWGIKINKWGSPMGNMANWLNFREDRTVTGYLNGPVEGKWHLVPLFSPNSPTSNPTLYGIWIEPNGAEKEEWIQCTLSISDEITLKAGLSGRNQTFEPITPQGLDQIKAARQIVLGTWTSTDVRYMGEVEKYTTDYSVTFHEDGTFTANMGAEQTGTWIVSDIMDAGDKDWTNGNEMPVYRYELYFDGHKEEVHCEVDSRNEAPEDADLSIYNPPKMNDRTVNFSRLNEEEAAMSMKGPTLPIGEWTSYYFTRIHNSTQDREGTKTDEYSLVFDPNGTFTAMLDTQISGTWEYTTMHRGDAVSFEYRLIADDFNTQMFIHDDGELSFSFNDPNDSDYRLFYQFKSHAEEQTPEEPNP